MHREKIDMPEQIQSTLKKLTKQLERVEQNLNAVHRSQTTGSQEMKMLVQGLTVLTKAIGTFITTFGCFAEVFSRYDRRLGDILEVIKQQLELERELEEEFT